jgi:hypothetical protein
MTQPAFPLAGTPTSRLWPWLALSVAANLFLAGWLIGMALTRPVGGPPDNFTARLQHRISPQGYSRIAGRLAELEQGVNAARGAFEHQRLKLIDIAAAPVYDARAMADALAGMAIRHSTEDDRNGARLVAILADLEAADRRTIAETLFSPPPGPPPQP